ncbi:hypothetical protein PENSUB_11187 [Penicillium subrubescens]|uniref:Uncharacterized protein n=1 Tax=Penicillium subrubescens TaxID=1316194 RepID=A0A1Q5T6A7_9EURO|nr:hypothetical protein PENSUB_11187 [Penicillium subrubescens]
MQPGVNGFCSAHHAGLIKSVILKFGMMGMFVISHVQLANEPSTNQESVYDLMYGWYKFRDDPRHHARQRQRKFCE